MNKENLLFLDTETTGLGPDDRLFQVAYSFLGKQYNELFKPPVPITIDSMVVSHVTNEMVSDKKPFEGSDMQKDLHVLLKENILVAHNTRFDEEMLRREGLEVTRSIDTYKISHYLDEKGEVPKHSLQYLRYYYTLDKDAVAHDALGDVLILEALFEKFFSQMMEKYSDESKCIEAMMQISSKPLFMKKFNFGKHNGRDVRDVAQEDIGYVRWLLNEKIMQRERGEGNDEDWIYTLDLCEKGNI